MAAPVADPHTAWRRKTRRAILVGYFGFAVLFIALSAIQVSRQALRFDAPSQSGPAFGCTDGIVAIGRAIERARLRSLPLSIPEEEAVEAYRKALQPEWSSRGVVAQACRADPDKSQLLQAVLTWGYAEEHGVRRAAVELAPVRRRAQELLRQQGLSTGAEPGPRP